MKYYIQLCRLIGFIGALLIVGCGGSDETGSKNMISSPGLDRSSVTYTFAQPESDPVVIDPDNAEVILREVVKTLSYLMKTYTPVDNEEGIYTDHSLKSVDSESFNCDYHGSYVGSMNAPSRLSYNGFRVFGGGDSYSETFNQCSDDSLYFDGSHSVDVKSGAFDG